MKWLEDMIDTDVVKSITFMKFVPGYVGEMDQGYKYEVIVDGHHWKTASLAPTEKEIIQRLLYEIKQEKDRVDSFLQKRQDELENRLKKID